MIRIVIIIGLFLTLLFPAGLQAATLTDEPTTESAKQAELRKQLEAKVAPLKRRGYTGKITQITDNALIIATTDGNKTVIANEGTKVVNIAGKNRQSVDFSSLKIGNSIVTIGSVETDGTMGAKVILAVAPRSETARAISGAVTSVSNRQMTIEQPRQKVNYRLTVPRGAKISVRGLVNPNFSDIGTGDRVVAIGTSDNEGIITVSVLHVVPNPANEATASPTKQATKSAKPTPQ